MHTVAVCLAYLQPIIENAIKYAIAQSEEGGTIRVSARVEEKLLILLLMIQGRAIPKNSPPL